MKNTSLYGYPDTGIDENKNIDKYIKLVVSIITKILEQIPYNYLEMFIKINIRIKWYPF